MLRLFPSVALHAARHFRKDTSGGPAIVGLASLRPVTLRPRLSPGLPFADPSVLVPLLHAAPWPWRGRYYAIVMFSLSNANVKATVAYYNIKATKKHASCGLPPISNNSMSAVAAGTLALSK